MKKLLLLFILSLFLQTSYSTDTVKVDRKFQLLVGYENDFYKEPIKNSLEIYSIGIGYKSKPTTLYTKFNLGYIDKYNGGSLSNQKQFELDLYQKISTLNNIWFNYAYSQSNIFPEHRISFAIWHKLPKSYLISTGVNHYIFDESVTFANVAIEKYISRYSFELKSIFYFKEPNITQSYQFTSRLYFKDINYYQLTLGLCSSEDEPFIILSNIDMRDSYMVKFVYVNNIHKDFRIRFSTTYNYEEYYNSLWRSRINVGLGFIFNLN